MNIPIPQSETEIIGSLFHKNFTSGLPVFHYTTPKGLLGILSSDSVRATSHDNLNDPIEKSYGINLILNILQLQLKEHDPDSDIIKQAMDYIDPSKTTTSIHSHPKYFIFSLSEIDDLLSQWIHYGGQGSGFSIGMSFPDFFVPKSFNQLSGKSVLTKIIYDEEKQQSLIIDTITAILLDFSEANRHLAVLSLIRILEALSLVFKQPGFFQEQEWRIIKCFPSGENDGLHDHIQFREHFNNIQSYVEMPFDDIISIRSGPSQNQSNVDRYHLLKIFGKNFGPNFTKVSALKLRA